jgi:hypothetical protein
MSERSDTPRTDEYAELYDSEIGRPAAIWEFARQLERECEALRRDADRINRVAATGSVSNWLKLPDEDKAKWFAATLKADKAKADMIRLLEDRAEATESRYRWLADKVIAPDYGDNEHGVKGYFIKHCKGPNWIGGDTLDSAIDQAIGETKG